MGNSVQELLEMLYTMISEAWGVPLGAEKCVIERDKALDLLDEIKAQFPMELNEAKRLTTARNEFIANAKREAESISKAAEDHARRLLDEQEIIRAAKEKAAQIIGEAQTQANAQVADAQNRSREIKQDAANKYAELRQMSNNYADDLLRRTEEAINEALKEVRTSRENFRAAISEKQQS